MIYGETNGDIGLGSFAEPDLRLMWNALEDRAREAIERSLAPVSLPIDPNPRTDKAPAASGRASTQIGLRLRAPLLAALDDWIARQPVPRPTRPEAIRGLLARSLEAERALAEICAGDLARDAQSEPKLIRLRRLVDELLYSGLVDAAAQTAQIIRSIERNEPIGGPPSAQV